ncbi:MAG TPA: glycosyl hydrolase 53 family protein [Candidatus Paceibacterota bacterium]|nr:glycosyl hydrolase 53 family protein [Candidatus Paceibacterota bacterium]
MKRRFKVGLAMAAVLAATSVLAANILVSSPEFLAGADMSFLNCYESRGLIYRDNGQAGDAIQILKRHGINCIRLRLFTSSAAKAAADPLGYINNLGYTVPLARRVKNAGLKFLLDFHYSDTWADPAHQAIPNAWTNLDFTQLVREMRDYNSNCIAVFKAAGAMPDYVQVGNEISSGMLWPLGRVPGTNATVQWSQLGQLMNAAIEGIREGAGTNMPQIIVHLDRGANWNDTKWFFDNLQRQNVPFDIIGESYYPFFQGPWTNIPACLDNAARRYGKPVMIVETDFPYIKSNGYYGIPGTTNGQVRYVEMLAQIMKNVPNGLGAGIFWWGTEFQYPSENLAGYGQRSFFDTNGNLLPAADALGALATTPAVAPTILNVTTNLSAGPLRYLPIKTL